jgi:hypothetical protein
MCVGKDLGLGREERRTPCKDISLPFQFLVSPLFIQDIARTVLCFVCEKSQAKRIENHI